MRKRPDLAERNRQRARHGNYRNNEPSGAWRSWRSMNQRVRRNKDAARYRDRGITVCERWRTFENFLADMGPRPSGCSIERIDNARGYEPGNCRWATVREQSQNRRSSRLVTVGTETLCVAEWARRLGVSRQTVRHRLEAGWAPETAVTTPASKKENSRWQPRQQSN
jgi:hypothetical protein